MASSSPLLGSKRLSSFSIANIKRQKVFQGGRGGCQGPMAGT
jgi:hypothetical protein